MKIPLITSLIMILSSVAFAGEKCTAIYFFEPDCPYCRHVKKIIIPHLREKYGNSFIIIKRDITKIKNFEAMVAFEKKYGIKAKDAPEFYTPFGVVYDHKKIQADLEKLIDKELGTKTPGPYAAFFNTYLKTGKK